MGNGEVNGRNVSYIKLHSEYFVLNLGPIPTTLTAAGPGNKYRDLKMTKVQDGVFCTATGVSGLGTGRKFEFLIPNGNITGMTFETNSQA